MMTDSKSETSMDQRAPLPSPFQNAAIQQSTIKTTTTASNETTFHGYRSNFNINQQKQIYQQRQHQNQNQRWKPNQNRFPNQNRQPNLNNSNNGNDKSSNNIGNDKTNWCDLCERGFKYPNQLEKHIDEHEKCWFDNCSFEGHTKLLQKHIENQHQSSLFQRIGKIETDEDIEKWREERRKRYPTAANIEARRQAQEERMKRGERLQEPNKRFGKNADRKSAQFQNNSDKQITPFKQMTEKKKRNRRQRNNNKIKARYNRIEKPTETSESASNEMKVVDASNHLITEEMPKRDCTNALAALVGLYGSDTEENDSSDEMAKVNEPMLEDTNRKRPIDDDSVGPSEAKQIKIDEISKAEVESNDESPEEQPIERTTNDVEMNENSSGPTEIVPEIIVKTEIPVKRPPMRKSIFDQTRKIRNQNTLLEKLLQKEIRHERNVLLQCVRYVVDNHFFGIGQENTNKT